MSIDHRAARLSKNTQANGDTHAPSLHRSIASHRSTPTENETDASVLSTYRPDQL